MKAKNGAGVESTKAILSSFVSNLIFFFLIKIRRIIAADIQNIGRINTYFKEELESFNISQILTRQTAIIFPWVCRT